MASNEDWTILQKFEEASAREKPRLIKSSEAAVEFLSKVSIEHNDQIIHRLVSLPVPKYMNCYVAISFQSSNSRWRQGLHLETAGVLEVAGTKSPKLILWRDTAPEKTTIRCCSANGRLRIWNVWDAGSGNIDSLINCAGIIVVQNSDSSLELRCNDGYPDDDFKDLVVIIELTE